MKKTLLFSTLLAVALNVWQFFASYHQREAAFNAPWTADAASSPAPAAKAVAAPATPAPSTAPAPPAADPAIATAARLSAAGLKPDFAALYLAVQTRTGTPWQLLAAVHQTETGQSGDTSRASYAGAIGPMQFMPATFRAWVVDGDGNGTTQITDLDDAMYTAGRYLAAGGADKGNYSAALYHYNHSGAYVSHVLSIAHRLGL